MYTLGSLCVAALGILLPCTAQVKSPAIAAGFPNGAMSSGTTLPDGWSAGWTGSGKVEVQRDTTTFKSAPASLCVRSVGGPAVGGAQHAVEITHAPFTISGFLKTGGSVKTAMLALQVFDSGGKQIDWINLTTAHGTSDWSAFSATTKLPPNAAAALLIVTLDGDGQVWLDDVSSSQQSSPQAVPAAEADALPVVIAPGSSEIRYVGRFSKSDPTGPRCAWPASTVALKFRGTALNAAIGDGPNDRWQVEVDGKPTVTLQMHNGKHLYRVVSSLPPGVHTVKLVKATEALFGTAQFFGFQLSKGGSLLPLSAPPHCLEVIGDSISCGYGDEASSQTEHFSAQTENAYFTYGATAARELNADYSCVAWSGKTMWPKNTIPELYDRTLPTQSDSPWDFTRWTPDVILINLATNDFAGKTAPDEVGWTDAYKAFIARLRTHFPQAQIYCATGPMMYGKPLSTLQTYLMKMIADIHATGDTRVHLLEFDTQDGKNGFGADWHPNLKTQRIMADKLAATLQADLGWKG